MRPGLVEGAVFEIELEARLCFFLCVLVVVGGSRSATSSAFGTLGVAERAVRIADCCFFAFKIHCSVSSTSASFV